MSDRVYTFTVTLDAAYRDEDVESIKTALAMVKGVADVVPLVADPQLYFACKKAQSDLGEKILNVIYPKEDDK